MSIRKEILSRAYIIFYLLMLAGVVIVVQVVRISTFERAYWVARGEEFSIKEQTIPAQRGNIYADDGSLLATSIHCYDIWIDFGSEALRDGYYNMYVDSLSCYRRKDI